MTAADLPPHVPTYPTCDATCTTDCGHCKGNHGQARLGQIRARAEAATEGPWAVEATGMPRHTLPLLVKSHAARRMVAEGYAGGEQDAAFIAAARGDVPYLLTLLAEKDATIQRLADRDLVQPAEWLGEKRTFTGEDAEEPGNDAYMEHIERVLTASGYDEIPWGPVLIAITLDRMVRENEKARALDEQEGR